MFIIISNFLEHLNDLYYIFERETALGYHAIFITQCAVGRGMQYFVFVTRMQNTQSGLTNSRYQDNYRGIVYETGKHTNSHLGKTNIQVNLQVTDVKS